MIFDGDAVVKINSRNDIEKELTDKTKEVINKGKIQEIIPVSDGEILSWADKSTTRW